MNLDPNFIDPSLRNESNANEFELEWVDVSLDAADLIEQEVIDAISVEATDDVAIEAELVSHAEVAESAQSQADLAIEQGDYAAAAELREVAEVEAELAGDANMLHGADSIELEAAAAHQENAEQLEWEQSQHAQEGDYEAARDDSFEAAWEQQQADSLAGGSDHSGQAQIEVEQMDWAIWNEDMAREHEANADLYAADGNLDAAARELELADQDQAMADWHGDLGEHGGSMSLDDPFSETANDHGFDYDASSGLADEFDASASLGDSYDAGVADLGTSSDLGSYDTGYDASGGYTEY